MYDPGLSLCVFSWSLCITRTLDNDRFYAEYFIVPANEVAIQHLWVNIEYTWMDKGEKYVL